MKRLVVVFILAMVAIGSPARADIDTVEAFGTTFVPSAITINAGDTIRWVRVVGTHTVTNGTGAGDAEAGLNFDESLGLATPTVELAFNIQGAFPYFCRFHELLGMTGTVTVTTPNNVPTARDTSLSTAEEIAVNGQMHGFDSDGDPFDFIVTSGPFNGLLTAFNSATGEFTYDPDLDYEGADSIIFVTDDGQDISGPGTVALTVTPVNDAPVADAVAAIFPTNTTESLPAMPVTDVDDVAWTIAHTSGPFHGSIANFNPADGSFDYTSALDYVGPDSIIYQADDGDDLSNEAVIRLTVLSGCDCPNHADPNPDGVTNVLDVVQTVNVGFRGASPVFDPNCPKERTDADCSGFTNVIDVVRLVNVAFRGADPVVQFCVPCAP
jgi:plastocyanin